MADKRKQSLRTQLAPSLHTSLMADLLEALDEHSGEFRVDYLKSSVLSKYVGPDTDPADVRSARAIEKWLQTELRNGKTNARLYGNDADFSFANSEDVLEFARRVVHKVLGSSPPSDLKGSFSGGASTRVKRDTGASARKFMGQADVTAEAWPYVLPLLMGCTAWFRHNPEVLTPRFVVGNIMFTVPKSTMIDRVACKEPELNMFAQKAIGDVIRRRLKRFGIDLNDQSVNRKLALAGSRDGSLATLDLSSASDSVSTALVGRLLPPAWFLLMDAVRSKRTVISGVVHENNMFSSMGNGFTFELESLIFYALARAVAYYTGTRGTISVYGDDIIVPRKMAASLSRCFSYFGFTVNLVKSHWKGRFRESCGGHYYRGADVTPFYVKEPIITVERLMHFLNRLRKWAGLQFTDICDPRFYGLWSKYAVLVDKRLWGGDDTAVPNQLVTRHKPRFKLVKAKFRAEKLETELQLGLYLQALCASDVRPVECYPSTLEGALDWAQNEVLTSEGSSLMVETSRWVLRRATLKVSSADFPLWYTPDGKLL